MRFNSLLTRTTAAMAFASCALYSTATLAGDDLEAGITISPTLSVLDAQRTWNTDLAKGGSLGLGYQFGGPWALELAYLKAKAGLDGTVGERTFEQLRIDSLYHFGRNENVQPYFVFGAGQEKVSDNNTSDGDQMANAGFGFKFAFNNAVSMRTDLRIVRNTDKDNNYPAVNFGMHFLLGADGQQPVRKPTPAPQAPSDSDGDGVLDKDDHCPGTRTGVPVDAYGCPERVDSDGDGVVDAKDQCPDSAAGSKVDAKGCYIELIEDVSMQLNVQFENNSDVVKQDSLSEVQKLAQFMREYPTTNVEIKGYTDDRGAESYNLQLSQKRARAVATLLSNRYGVDASRVKAIGFGEQFPIATNDTAEGRAKNRRVEASVKATRKKIVR